LWQRKRGGEGELTGKRHKKKGLRDRVGNNRGSRHNDVYALVPATRKKGEIETQWMRTKGGGNWVDQGRSK